MVMLQAYRAAVFMTVGGVITVYVKFINKPVIIATKLDQLEIMHYALFKDVHDIL